MEMGMGDRDAGSGWGVGMGDRDGGSGWGRVILQIIPDFSEESFIDWRYILYSDESLSLPDSPILASKFGFIAGAFLRSRQIESKMGV